MYLVISEKPSVSQSIGKVIGAYKKEDGYLEGRDCVVSWCLGHLAEYVSPEIYDDSYHMWKFEDLPIVPNPWQLAVAKDKKKQYQILKKLLNRNDFDYVVNACDAGREGELIFKRVYDLSGSKLPVKRLWISSMEDKAIQDGFSKLKDGSEYENLAEASVCRAKADWLIGMNATRALTTSYGKKLIVGRVQSPTLSMLAERSNQIQNFQKQKYFNVSLKLDGLIAEKQKIQFEEEAEEICEKCNGQTATVQKISTAEKTINPPRLYDLTSLQREANRHYGLTAQQTLNCAQSLYEKKLTTYPRTDSQFLTEDMKDNAEKVIALVKKKYGFDNPFDETTLSVNIGRVLNNKKVSDHHAIIPTLEIEKKENVSLSKDEGRVLYLIVIRLLEAVGEPHRYVDTEVTVECMGELFLAKGKEIKNLGWKALEEQIRDFGESNADTEDSMAIRPVSEGEQFYGAKAKKSEHYTSPPKAYSEDTLLAAMENAYVFDFDPARTLTIFEEFANDLCSGTSSGRGNTEERKQNVRELLNFFPVIGEDEDGELVEMDAEQVLVVPRKIRSTEVVKRGFMSNFLFQNISNVFGAPKVVLDILNQFEPVKDPGTKGELPKGTENIPLNDDGEIEIPEDIVIGKAEEVFGDKRYAEPPVAVTEAMEKVPDIHTAKEDKDAYEKYAETLKTAAREEIAKPVVEAAKDIYKDDLNRQKQKQLETHLQLKVDSFVDKTVSNYAIEQNKAEQEKDDALSSRFDTGRTPEEIRAEFEARVAKNAEELKQRMEEGIKNIQKESMEDAIKTGETAKAENEKSVYDTGIRDHLRGFSRTIPSFLMAYGGEHEVTLATFDKIIPDEVFREVTSISLEQFRFLRDGGDYVNAETSVTEHFNGNLFDPVVFDDSVKEFMIIKKKLANYFDPEHKEDIFDYIPPQKTNQIFTPKRIVKDMVDRLERENPGCFDDDTKTFADLYMKSGLYITEIVTRLYNSETMKVAYPNDAERLNHIFARQVYGLAPTEIIYKICLSYILGFSDDIKIEKYNIRKLDAVQYAQDGTLEEQIILLFPELE